jgi:hypothetical protein
MAAVIDPVQGYHKVKNAKIYNVRDALPADQM